MRQRPTGPQPIASDELREIRITLGWAQEDLACALGMPGQHGQVYRWETGKTKIRPPVAMAIRSLIAEAPPVSPAPDQRHTLTLCESCLAGVGLFLSPGMTVVIKGAKFANASRFGIGRIMSGM